MPSSRRGPVIPGHSRHLRCIAKVFGTTATFLGGFLETMVLIFLHLATGELFTRKVARVMPEPAKGTAEGTVDEAEGVVADHSRSDSRLAAVLSE